MHCNTADIHVHVSLGTVECVDNCLLQFMIVFSAGARMWGPYKELFQLVESAIIRKHPEATQDLEVALRKHKPDFYALLHNPVSMLCMSHACENKLVKHLALDQSIA